MAARSLANWPSMPSDEKLVPVLVAAGVLKAVVACGAVQGTEGGFRFDGEDRPATLSEAGADGQVIGLCGAHLDEDAGGLAGRERLADGGIDGFPLQASPAFESPGV